MNEKKLAAVIAAQDEYIALLGEEIDSIMPIASVHGWETTRREAGADARAKIAAAKKAAREE